MRYAPVMIALLSCAALQAVETIKITETSPEALRVESITGKDHEAKERPLYLVLEYLAAGHSVTFALTDDAMKKIPISTEYITANPKASWRAILDTICRDKKLRVDDSRLEKEHLIVISKPQLISVKFKDADIREVLWSIAQTGKVNIVIDPDVKGNVTVSLTDVAADEAIITVAKTLDYVAVKEKSGEFRVK